MVKEKWGAKQTCPKCGTRFYDLGKANPAVCLDCGNEWVPEPILKSRQPQPEEVKKAPEAKTGDKDLDKDEKAAIDEEIKQVEENTETNPDNDLDLDDGADVAEVIQTPKTSGNGE